MKAEREHKCFSCGYKIQVGDEEETVPISSKVTAGTVRYRHVTWEQCQAAARRPTGWTYRGVRKPVKR